MSLRRVYADLDGTLLGPGGSLVAHPDGPTGEPAAVLAEMAERGVELVLMSGRTRDQAREAARLVGAIGYIAELGGLIVRRGPEGEVLTRNHGAFTGPGTPHQAMVRSGAAGFLLDAYGGRLEPHTPWSSLPRECSVLLRGKVSPAEVGERLAANGYGWLELLDNGVIASSPSRFPSLRVGAVHAYHLVPVGVSKRSAVRLDRRAAGREREECVAVGDAASDAAVAPEVGTVFLVANAAGAVSGADLAENVTLTERSHGLGFAEAVRPLLDAAD